MIKVNLLLDRLLELLEVEAVRIYRQAAHEGGKVVCPMNQPPLLPRRHPWYSFLLEVELALGPQCGQKDYVKEILSDPLGIKPAAFCLVMCLNQLHHRTP